ncbi:hypothetical protein QBC46DRAFT_99918 [Diplogelasinospora grovesii]|uniref:BTB domain-containing protein n=1 Tax=Diplogelasinospora grovesii TaxID=303347 RepID=A0AAN6N959_9PEZI|nr:hypothetical protein QBC46DRAFT_99918 [Diplogelasinospora grovesii]
MMPGNMECATKKAAAGLSLGCDTVRVLVGREQREFTLHKKPLCTSSSYFRDKLSATPAGLSSSLPTDSHAGTGAILWLPSESPDMFELFVLWLYHRRSFRTSIDDAIHLQTLSPPPSENDKSSRRTLHWSLVRLHIFAALASIPTLQDVAMDALQDLYLRCDWDMSPRLIAFLYGDCATEHSFRLRKWAVAMVAWTLYGGHGCEKASQFERLFSTYGELWEDYCVHLDKMTESKADVRVKNPQLRLPQNKLRNEERYFGFRQCSFHSHRSTVGEGSCPHLLGQSPSSPWMKQRPKSIYIKAEMKTETEMESDDSEEEYQDIISPVSEEDMTCFLDLS